MRWTRSTGQLLLWLVPTLGLGDLRKSLGEGCITQETFKKSKNVELMAWDAGEIST